ncbi:MAG: YceI family protein [Reichenbachiella sp.]
MNTIKAISKITAILFFAVFAFRCEDDDPAQISKYTISGNVTYPDYTGASAPANGAIVYLKLNATEATTAFDLVTVADVSGQFSFAEIPDGQHFVFANFDDMNSNNPAARTRGVMFGSEGIMVTMAGENVTQALALVSMGQSNAVAVNTNEGGDWFQDWSHSNVDFEFPYDAENATYTGRFSGFEMYIDFDPADLANSSIQGTIDGLSIKTDSPGGRDALYNSDGSFWQDPVDNSYDLGCVSAYFGIDAIDDTDRYITFESTSIEAYGDGYLATGPMVFNGNTVDIEMPFKFIPGYQAENRSGILTQFSSFQGEFDFAALDDFGIASGHVGDADVTVKISFQVTQPVN